MFRENLRRCKLKDSCRLHESILRYDIRRKRQVSRLKLAPSVLDRLERSDSIGGKSLTIEEIGFFQEDWD